MSKSHIYLLTVAVLLLTALTIAWMNNDEQAMSPTSESAPTVNEAETTPAVTDLETVMDTGAVVVPQNMVMLAENETGNRVTVASATLNSAGFVVLFRTNSLGDVDTIGSSQLLEAGTYADLSIQVDSAVVKEQQLIAVLYADDGDAELELDGEDTFLTNTNGLVVLDIDVIDTDPADEAQELTEQAQALME